MSTTRPWQPADQSGLCQSDSPTFDPVLDVHDAVNAGAHQVQRIARGALNGLTDVPHLTLKLR